MAASDWSERTRMLVTVGISLALNAGVGIWCYMAQGNLAALEKEHKGYRGKIDSLRAEVEKRDSLKTRLVALQNKFAVQQKMLPNTDDTSFFIEKMAELGTKTGAQNKSATYNALPSTGGNIERGVWHTRWKASYWSLVKLINEMEENFPRFVSFENLTITPKNSGMVPTGAIHEVSVDLIVYRYVQQ